MLAGALVLARSAVAGGGLPPRLGFAVALLGLFLLAVAEGVLRFNSTSATRCS